MKSNEFINEDHSGVDEDGSDIRELVNISHEEWISIVLDNHPIIDKNVTEHGASGSIIYEKLFVGRSCIASWTAYDENDDGFLMGEGFMVIKSSGFISESPFGPVESDDVWKFDITHEQWEDRVADKYPTAELRLDPELNNDGYIIDDEAFIEDGIPIASWTAYEGDDNDPLLGSSYIE